MHPVLLLAEGEEADIQHRVNTDDTWKEVHFAILEKSNTFFRRPLLQRQMTGRRLLSVSRDCIHRVFYLAYAYRMTGEERFAKRAEEEMLAVAAFSDWNPSHFLDVAEMTLGMAIGYDWLYHYLPESSRKTIRYAIKTKGLDPSFDNSYNWFLGASHNWNQVCNAGMVFGALAVEGVYPDLARLVIDRAIETIPRPMTTYQPSGAYPEGYAYWGYGTTMNVLLIQALEEAYGTDYGLSETPGFLPTAEFMLHMVAPSSTSFNWGDCSPGGRLQPAMFWFAQQANAPSLLYMEKKFLEPSNDPKYDNDRLLPALMIWAKGIPLASVSPPDEKVWVGQGANPVALMRTAWNDPRAIYLGFKAGSPSVNHGHMDIGSFVMEADGVRWAADFGLQNYESLESKGIQVFGTAQDAQRWTIFRLNNYAHNTLTIDDALQRVDGYARIDRYSDAADFTYAISDISSVYDGHLASAVRGAAIIDQQYVLVQDEIRTLDKPTTIRWNMLTPAVVSLGEKGATLIEDGKTLQLQVIGPEGIQMKTWSTDPDTDYDAPNPGTTFVGFEYNMPPNSSETFRVVLVPESAAGAVAPFDKALADW